MVWTLPVTCLVSPVPSTHWQLPKILAGAATVICACSEKVSGPLIIASQNGLGWKGLYRSSSSDPSTMGIDTFH